MKGFKDFEKKMQDKEFAALFSNAETDEEIVKIAAGQGYKITKKDAQSLDMSDDMEISDDMLESVAGGMDTSGGIYQHNMDTSGGIYRHNMDTSGGIYHHNMDTSGGIKK